MPSIVLFNIIARIGCLLVGCCYGIEIYKLDFNDRVPIILENAESEILLEKRLKVLNLLSSQQNKMSNFHCYVSSTIMNEPSTPSGQKLEHLAGLFAAMRSGKTLKGSKHSGGFPTSPDDKNPRRPTLISVRMEY